MIDDIDLILGFRLFLLLFGIIYGMCISEINTDVIRNDILNEVCSELYGENYFYEENTYFISPESNSFDCKFINTIPKKEIEIKSIKIKEDI